MEDKISGDELKKLLCIGENSFYSYIKNGDLPKPSKSADGETLFSRSQIARILGIEELPDEPLITTKDAISILKLPESFFHGNIRKYCKSRKLPYYTLKDGKGSKTYFIRSELEAAVKYLQSELEPEHSFKRNLEFPDFVARNHMVTEVIKYVFNSTLLSKMPKKGADIIIKMLFEKRSFKDIAAELGYVDQSVRNTMIVACKRAIFELKAMENRMKMLDSVFDENIRLRSENKVLLDRLNETVAPEKKITEEEVSLLSKQIKSTPVSLGANSIKRVYNFLDQIEATSLNDLVKYKRSDIQKFRNIGSKTLEAIESLLKANGLRFKPEDNELVKVPQKALNESEELKKALLSINERLNKLENGSNTQQ